jgi:hypothetical protein
VLRDDGTVWLNVGDSYAGTAPTPPSSRLRTERHRYATAATWHPAKKNRSPTGCKQKDLIGIPWMLAFALRGDGWYLRSEVIWAKRNGLPDGRASRRPAATARTSTSSCCPSRPRYFYDAAAIREQRAGPGTTTASTPVPTTVSRRRRPRTASRETRTTAAALSAAMGGRQQAHGRSGRESVHRYPGAHFATFPPKLVEPCVLAGSPPGQTVLDPFAGAGTTGLVALRHDRSFIGIELNEDYCELARQRIRDDAPLLNVPAEAA